MAESILKKYAERRAESESGSELAADAEADAGTAGAAFGVIRGNAREKAVMLELRKANGSIMAVGYSWLEQVDFDPSDGITLHVAGKRVRIKGRNLNAGESIDGRLFSSLCRHRVQWVREADRSASVVSEDDATSIEAIEW